MEYAENRFMEQIRSRKNQYILHLRALARDKDVRRDAGEYVCDGEKLLREALQFGAEVTSVLWRDAAAFPLPDGAAQYMADAELVAYASPLMHSPGPVFTVRLPEMRLPQPLRHVIVLEGVQDPGNVGTVIRTANALGMDAVVLTGACADLYSPKTVRAAMGALFRQPVLTCTTDELMQLLRANCLKLYGAALTDAAQDLRCVPLSPAAVAIGSEGRGLSAQLLAQCVKAPLVVVLRAHGFQRNGRDTRFFVRCKEHVQHLTRKAGENQHLRQLVARRGFLHVRVHFLAAQRCNCAVTVGVRQTSCRQVQFSAQCRKLPFLRSVFNMV